MTSSLTDADRSHLVYAIELAERGRVGARPNPVVGAVLARGEEVIATGYHARWGDRHAERICLDAAADVPEDATLYLSLEPCAHRGQQPPCAPTLVERGVRRVVIAAADPNPQTSGRGPRLLEEAGIEVLWAHDELCTWARVQNAGFRSRHIRQRPWVRYKWAQTSDGFLATGDPERRWVSGEVSRLRAHLLRAASDAVAVGVETAIADDCLLTVRGGAATGMFHPPLRVVYDRTLRLPVDRQLVRTADHAPLLVVCGPDADESRERALRAYGAQIWRAPDRHRIIRDSLEHLAVIGVGDLLLESGPMLAEAFRREGVVDELICYASPHPSTGRDSLPHFEPNHPFLVMLECVGPVRSGEDMLFQIDLGDRP